MGIVNYTHTGFTNDQKNVQGEPSQTGYAAQTLHVTVRVPEFAGKPTMFHMQRSSNPLLNGKVLGSTVTAQNGSLSLCVSPLETVTLRSGPVRP